MYQISSILHQNMPGMPAKFDGNLTSYFWELPKETDGILIMSSEWAVGPWRVEQCHRGKVDSSYGGDRWVLQGQK